MKKSNLIKENTYKINKHLKKKKDDLIGKEIKNNSYLNFKNRFNLLLTIYFIITFLPLSLSETKRKISNKRNKISLIINKKGSQEIINPEGEFTKPDKVIINNNEEKINLNMIFDLPREQNEIDLIWENTSTTSFKEMFKNINNLISVDFSNFDASKITDMYGLFNNCPELQHINFMNFDTSSVINMGCMFCHATLTSLDLSTFNTSSVQNMKYMFYNCKNIKTLNLSNFNTKSVIFMNLMFSNMQSLISLDLSNFDTSSVSTMNYMFEENISLVYLNLISFEEKNKEMTIDDMFSNNMNKLIYCIDEKKSPNITSLLKSKNFIYDCENICFSKSKIIIINKKECVDGCKKEGNFTCNDNDTCYNSCFEDTDINNKKDEKIENKQNFSSENFFKEKQEVNTENITMIDDIIKNIREDILKGNLNSLLKNITNGKDDLIVKKNDTIFQITTTENQKNNTNKNISTLNLGDCEDRLKQIYEIPNHLSLIIFKVDYYKEGSLIPVICYEIYDPINKTQLDLNYCKDILVNLNIPVSIDEDNYFKYDPNSEYYNDVCYTYTTDNDTDIILNDRQNEYNDNNLSICENNCTLNGYDNENKKVSCECEVKSKISLISEIIDNDEILSNNFTNGDKSTSNIVTMKCVYTLFSKDGLLTNLGNYILLFSIILFLISIIIVYKCGLYKIEYYIKEIIFLKTKSIKRNNHSSNKNIFDINKNHKRRKIKKVNMKNSKISNPNKKFSKKALRKEKENSVTNSKINCKKLDSLINNEKSQKENIIIYKTEKKNHNNFNNINYNDCEMNSFTYEEALEYDNRTFLQFFFSLLKRKNIIIFSFFPMNDYNIRIIKICLFFLFFDIYFAINTLLFNHSTIHQIYKDKGIYNLSYFLPKIILSFIITYIIITIIKYYSLTENNILELKKEKRNNNLEDKAEKIKKTIIIKYIIFFILSYLFLIFFWYYLSSFCAVYKNSQAYLIKNTLISFSIGLIFPCLFVLITSIFRIFSLKKRKETLFKVSKIIQIM